jgi:hypothetical protein
VDFSFCIITDGSPAAQDRILDTIESIQNLQIENYEILCIGGMHEFDISKIDWDMIKNFKRFYFDESVKPGWITKKKNEIARLAKYENLVLFHDYYIFDREWYNGYNRINDQTGGLWHVSSNPVVMINGQRDYTDWVTYDHPKFGIHWTIDYNNWNLTEYQYISGGYFVVKKEFFLENLFDENMIAGQEEDVEWSKRVRTRGTIICNPYSIVRQTKKHRNLGIIPKMVPNE